MPTSQTNLDTSWEAIEPGDAASKLREVMAKTIVERVVWAHSGGQIRSVISGSRTVATLSYPSKRYHRSFYVEGSVEETLLHKAETLVDHLDYLPQPCRIEATVDGKPACAIPDYAVVRSGSVPALGEAKGSWSDFDKGRAIVQQAITRKGADALGWSYEQSTSSNVGSADFLDSIRTIQGQRFLHLTRREERDAIRILDAVKSISLGELAAGTTACPARGCNIVYALMVRRIAEIDLSIPLGDASIVKRGPKIPTHIPPIWR